MLSVIHVIINEYLLVLGCFQTDSGIRKLE